MIKLKVFLLCLTVIFTVFSMVVCIEMVTLERAFARGVYQDIMDDMQDIGYLDGQLASYYANKMSELGWVGENGDFYTGTWPREVASRSYKERNELVSLTLTIRPSRITQWAQLLFGDEPVFRFNGRRPSEYFDSGW